MFVDLFVFDVALLQQTLVQLLHCRLPLLLLEQHPLVEVLLQLLQVLLLDHLYRLDLHLQDLQLLEVLPVNVLQLKHPVSDLFLPWVLSFPPLYQRVHSVDPFKLLQLSLKLVDFSSRVVYDGSYFLALHLFVVYNCTILLHCLMFSVGFTKLFKGTCMIEHLLR